MSAGKKVISRPHALFSYSAPKKTQMSESESVNDVIRSTSQKKSDSETMMERKTGTPVKKQQTINNTPPVHKMNNIRRSQSAYTLERTPVKQESLPPRPSSEVRTLQSKVKMSPRGNRVENNSNEQLTRRLIGSGQSPNIRIPQQSPRKIHDVDRTPQSPRSLRTPQSPRFLKTSRDSRNIPTSLPKTNASEKKTVKREFPQSGIVQIKTSVRTIHTIKDDSDTDGNFITPNNSTPLTHNVKYIRAHFEKSNVKPPPSPTPSKHRVRFNENVQMYVERSSSSPEITPTRKSSVDNNVATNRTELRGIRTPSCKTGNVQDHISSGHEPSAGTFLRKSCLRRSLSDHCLVFGGVTAVLSWPTRQSRGVKSLSGLMVLGSRRRSPVRSSRYGHHHQTKGELLLFFM